MHKLVVGSCQVVPEAPRAAQAGQPVKAYAKVLFLGGAYVVENPKGFTGEFKSVEIAVTITADAKVYQGRGYVGSSVRFGEILSAAK